VLYSNNEKHDCALEKHVIEAAFVDWNDNANILPHFTSLSSRPLIIEKLKG